MDFDAVLARVLELLQRDMRVSYRALKRRFDLDDEYLEDLKAEIIKAKKLAIDEDGEVLVWTGNTGTTEVFTSTQPAQQEATQADQPVQIESPPPATRSTPDAERRQMRPRCFART